MTIKKELLTSIVEMEAKILKEQSELRVHRRYFRQFSQDNRLLLVALLLPSFLSGWQMGKRVPTAGFVKQFGKFALMTVFSNIRSQNL